MTSPAAPAGVSASEGGSPRENGRDAQHFLLTRYNVPMDGVGGVPGREPAWLEHRLRLFDAYCRPSVAGQSNRDFTWLVFLDAETPQPYRAQIEERAEGGLFEPVYVPRFSAAVAQEAVVERLRPGVRHVITTRLDNDDAIGTDFVAHVQGHFAGEDLELLNLPFGYVWAQGKLFLHRQLSNPFISMVERVGGSGTGPPVRTVFCAQHHELPLIGPIRQIRVPPAWLQVVHERNVSNTRNGIRLPVRKLASGFSLAVELPRESWAACRAEQLAGILSYAGRRLARAVGA